MTNAKQIMIRAILAHGGKPRSHAQGIAVGTSWIACGKTYTAHRADGQTLTSPDPNRIATWLLSNPAATYKTTIGNHQ